MTSPDQQPDIPAAKSPNGGEVPGDESHVLTDLEHLYPADAADHIENLPLDQQVELVQNLPVENAAELIAEMDRYDRETLIKELASDHAADILEEMSPDDAADILDEMDEGDQRRLLKRIDLEEATQIRNLLAYEPDSAGGVMNTEMLVLEQAMTVDEAITYIRGVAEDAEIPYYAYVVDQKHRLLGVVSLRDLLLNRPNKPLRELLVDQSIVSTSSDTDKEEVAMLISRYNLMALPVVDRQNRLLGVVTHDDVMDIIHEEASEDMLGMVGAGMDETVDTPWKHSVRMRLPWLIINVANSAIAAYVVHQFEGTITQMAVLATLMPIVANQAGNAGQQSLAVMIRHLAIRGYEERKAWEAVGREIKIGFLNGLLVALLVMAGVLLLTGKPALAQVMALALGLDMVIGCAAGVTFPILLKKLGRDPAQASSIFLTTVTDSCGFLIFLGLASLFLL